MQNNEIIKRSSTYSTLASELSLLSDSQLSTLLEKAAPIGASIGGSSAILTMNGIPVFIKKIRVTDIERIPENVMNTANIFHLPLYYQYGIGSTGFGAWRELSAHIHATNWVLAGECLNFPLLYHWRLLPSERQAPDEQQLVRLDKDVKYWNNSPDIRNRLEANMHATADIVLFLEYFQHNLYQWFGNKIAQGDAALESGAVMIEDQSKQTISFMKSKNFIHFDAHFHNILTDGNRLYFSDFGLSVSSDFSLSEDEKAFFCQHRDYDRYCLATNFLHCFVTHYVGEDSWTESLEELVRNDTQKLPANVSTVIEHYAPTALVMNKFYLDLQKNKMTTYPAKTLELAWYDI